jgi:twitching motility protein PilT
MNIIDLVKKAVEESASDLHVRAGKVPRLRIDGELFDLKVPPLTQEDLRVFFFGLLSEEQRRTFDEKKELDFAYSVEGLCRLRINLFHERGNFSAALRIIPGRIPTMEEIQLPPACRTFVGLNRGLVLVTGPSGSGKSTTLAAMIDYINQHRRCHILTIEDPVEYVFEDRLATISQREVSIDTLSFLDSLVHSFRQDPDVIMVGEMRDLETMQTAITLAETGHLTFSTLHTGGAAQTIHRVIDSFPPHQQQQVQVQLSEGLEGIISQRLLPLRNEPGRIAAREVLICTRAVKTLIREGKIAQIATAIQTGTEEGMITMDRALSDLYERGQISYKSAIGAAADKKEFAAQYANRKT